MVLACTADLHGALVGKFFSDGDLLPNFPPVASGELLGQDNLEPDIAAPRQVPGEKNDSRLVAPGLLERHVAVKAAARPDSPPSSEILNQPFGKLSQAH